MIRQEVFNNCLVRHTELFNNSREELIKLYVAWRMTNMMAQRGLKPKAVINTTNTLTVSDFGVKEGRFILNYYDPREGGISDDRLLFSNGLILHFNNTWLAPAAEETATADAEGEGRTQAKRSSISGYVRGECFEADQCMDQPDVYLVYGAYEQAMSEIVTLVANGMTLERPETNRSLVEGVVYNLNERDRVMAAWMFLEYIKFQPVRADDDPVDIRIMHLVTGAREFGYSGNYGTEQDWIKIHGHHRGVRRAEDTRPSLTLDEQGFLDYFHEYLEGARSKRDPDERRHRPRR